MFINEEFQKDLGETSYNMLPSSNLSRWKAPGSMAFFVTYHEMLIYLIS
jgi:hypothetical protein